MDMSTYNADSLEQWQHQLAPAIEDGMCDIDDSSTAFLVNSRTLMGCIDPLRRGGLAHAIRVPSVWKTLPRLC